MNIFLSNPKVHFTGYANILSENNFKGVIGMEHLYIQLVGEEKLGCQLNVVNDETEKILLYGLQNR